MTKLEGCDLASSPPSGSGSARGAEVRKVGPDCHDAALRFHFRQAQSYVGSDHVSRHAAILPRKAVRPAKEVLVPAAPCPTYTDPDADPQGAYTDPRNDEGAAPSTRARRPAAVADSGWRLAITQDLHGGHRGLGGDGVGHWETPFGDWSDVDEKMRPGSMTEGAIRHCGEAGLAHRSPVAVLMGRRYALPHEMLGIAQRFEPLGPRVMQLRS